MVMSRNHSRSLRWSDLMGEKKWVAFLVGRSTSTFSRHTCLPRLRLKSRSALRSAEVLDLRTINDRHPLKT